jgi:sulfate adenylyltransferase subunit 2
MELQEGETPVEKLIRFRSLGCYPLSAAVESPVRTLDELITELVETRLSERAGRLIDGEKSASMEAKKMEGYF